MIRYTKLAANGGSLPDDATDHLAVRVENDLLVRPLIIANAMPPKGLTHQQAVQWAEKLDIYSWSWRLISVEEAFMSLDRSRPDCALPLDVFTQCEATWIWTATLDAQPPSGCAWYVNLDNGDSDRYHRDDHCHALAVRAGQF